MYEVKDMDAFIMFPELSKDYIDAYLETRLPLIQNHDKLQRIKKLLGTRLVTLASLGSKEGADAVKEELWKLLDMVAKWDEQMEKNGC